MISPQIVKQDINTKNILWKASARRQGRLPEYEGYKYEYSYGRVSFKSKNKVERDLIKRYYKAIRFRINGGLLDPIWQPIGAWQIHNHAVNEIHEIIEELDEQTGEESKLSSWPFYTGEMKKLRVNIHADIKTKNKAICFIMKNWSNHLHNSQLPNICEALNEAEKHLKKLGYKKITKIIFTEKLEAKGRKTLDLTLNDDITFYSVPYIKPYRLDEQIRIKTGIRISNDYPAKDSWSKPIKDLLKRFLWKLLLRRLYEKGQKYAEGYKDKPKKHVKTGILNASILQIDLLSSYLKRRLNRGDPVSEANIDTPTLSEILSYPQEIDTGKPQVKIKIPEKPIKIRFSVSKKKSRRKYLREWAKRYIYPQFYRRVATESNPRKHIVINFEAMKLLDGEKFLNDSIYSLMNYKPKDQFRMRERNRLLKTHIKLLWKFQNYN